ncbi:hypothetical protein [Curtobacterium sp. MCSS17_016]|uniref:hypothetical protein n=1 Tax=Curtobacterium sp. MCSS17_016 TaxID=2175644 RepID=UPI000DAA15C8|nr:hypothetical protein [Curtobacterium sp. MCSS17_016]WIE80955.1 hypothetical protein DEJ19_020780 [Curtobacterium sp. MCSS17_016]
MSIADLAARLEAARTPELQRRFAVYEAVNRNGEADISDDAAHEGLPLRFAQVTALIHGAPAQDPRWATERVRTLNRMRKRIYRPLLDDATMPLTLHLPGGSIDHPGSDVTDVLDFYGQVLTAGADPAIARYLSVSNLVAAGYPFLRLPFVKAEPHPEMSAALAAARDGRPLRYLELVVETAGR